MFECDQKCCLFNDYSYSYDIKNVQCERSNLNFRVLDISEQTNESNNSGQHCEAPHSDILVALLTVVNIQWPWVVCMYRYLVMFAQRLGTTAEGPCCQGTLPRRGVARPVALDGNSRYRRGRRCGGNLPHCTQLTRRAETSRRLLEHNARQAR